MARRRRNAFDRQHGGSVFVTEFVHMLGIIDLLATFVGVVVVLAMRMAGEQPVDGGFVLTVVFGFIAGVTLGGLLLGLAGVLRYAYTIARARDAAPARDEVDQPVTYAAPATSSTNGSETSIIATPTEPLNQHHVKEMLALIREIRDLTVLPPAERSATADRVRVEQHRRAAEVIIDALNLRQVGKARELLRSAQATYGPTPTFEKIAEKIQEADARNESLDYTRTRRLVEESIAEGNWAMAEQYARPLHRDHPDSPRCRRLWDDARRTRLRAHVQESANNHHWDEAVAAAEEFIERFPDHIDSEALRDQLGTLKANAEIQHRKRYENKFKELMSAKHYAEALRMARLIIDQFPGSPQALALENQVPILQRRANS